ncbi:hypothetical protein F2Q70_00022228 [Brassica cretica]|uniref:Uncharacterized protein n=1 Tax=Brassica cretica TaxID=69181 RepID=A0A8S9GN85_BRACR|nr:hypothetical protein F2Q70_00022228 [Brassica cretica]
MRKTVKWILTSPIIPLTCQIKGIRLSHSNYIRDYTALCINQLSCEAARATFFVSPNTFLVDLKYERFDLLCLSVSGVRLWRNSAAMNNVSMNSVSMNSVRMNSMAMNSARVNSVAMNSVQVTEYEQCRSTEDE